jgi:hypothetical protein
MDKRLEKIYKTDLDIWGLPQVYKEVKFYPIKLVDVYAQELFYKIFQYPKNYIPEKKILKMSYLKYLLYIVQGSVDIDGSQISNGLLEFLKYVTKEDDIKYNYFYNNGEDFFENLILEVIIGGKKFTEQDFDIIRGIILQQNGLSIEYVEEFDPSLEKLLAYSHAGASDMTLEDQICTFATMNQMPINAVENYTLYQFKKHFIRSAMFIDYTLFSPLETSGQIKSKTGEKIVKNYMEHMHDRSRYDSILIPQDELAMRIPGIQGESGV